VITPAYCQLLARYGRWMNERLYASVRAMSDDARKRDRGAFFGSIHRTLSHLVWADSSWLSRFTGGTYAERAWGADLFDDFAQLAAARDATDTAILDWAGSLDQAWLDSTLEYRASSDPTRKRQVPAWIAATHLFNHATHHRGQLTTLLKQAGIDPGVTDLPALPGVVRILE
jgi:uncharacterized damage-inducible protein DinB